jgi:hypothetical protein
VVRLIIKDVFGQEESDDDDRFINSNNLREEGGRLLQRQSSGIDEDEYIANNPETIIEMML